MGKALRRVFAPGFAAALALLLLAAGCGGESPRRIDFPTYSYRSDITQELVSVEVSDASTVLSFKSFFNPGWYINISPGAYLTTDGKDRYYLIGSSGITPGTELYMDENGNAEYQLIFEPLPPGTTDVSLIEQEDAAYAFNFYHICLDPSQAFTEIPALSVTSTDDLPHTDPFYTVVDVKISRPQPLSRLAETNTPISYPLSGLPEANTPTSHPLSGLPEANTPASQPLSGLPEANTPASQPLSGLPEAHTPASHPLSGLPEVNIPASQPLAGLPDVKIALVVKILDQDQLAVLDENGSTSFKLYLSRRSQAFVELGNGNTSDPFVIEAGSHLTVTLDGSSRALTTSRFSLPAPHLP